MSRNDLDALADLVRKRNAERPKTEDRRKPSSKRADKPEAKKPRACPHCKKPL